MSDTMTNATQLELTSIVASKKFTTALIKQDKAAVPVWHQTEVNRAENRLRPCHIWPNPRREFQMIPQTKPKWAEATRPYPNTDSN